MSDAPQQRTRRKDRPYSKIYKRIWRDEKFRKLSEGGQRLALYFLTSPQSNRIGLYPFSRLAARDDLRLARRGYKKRETETLVMLNWSYDEDARVIFLPSWWRYNHPENVNIFKSNLFDIHDLPQTHLIDTFLDNTAYLRQEFWQTLATCRSNVGLGWDDKEPKPKPELKLKPKPKQEQESGDESDLKFNFSGVGLARSGRPEVADLTRVLRGYELKFSVQKVDIAIAVSKNWNLDVVQTVAYSIDAAKKRNPVAWFVACVCDPQYQPTNGSLKLAMKELNR